MVSRPSSKKLLAALSLYAAAWVFFSVVGRFHDRLVLPPGVDPLLAALPYFKLSWLLTTGFLLFHVSVFIFWVRLERDRLPYYVSMMAFWMFVRAVFIALGPVGAPPSMAALYTAPSLSFLRGTLFFDTEQFFSGHTGMPYLYFLLSKDKTLRRLCLAFSVIMGVGVLVSRNHYWIDVLGAYFMTYSIWRLGRGLWAGLERSPVLARF